MTANPRFLWPELPPELRNEIYDYLSIPDKRSIAMNTGLPMQLKEYSNKHTIVQICPVHYGSTSLLALERFRFHEAHEYYSWLLNNALELRFGVIFKGRVNTFIQADWDKKIEMHLRKLAKQYPWLKKVAKYGIQVVWDSIDGLLKSRKSQRTMGQISKDMVKTLTVLMDENLKGRRGDVDVGLYLEHRIAMESALSATKFGLADFFSASDGSGGCWRLTQGIWKQPCLRKTQTQPCFPRLVNLPATSEEKVVLYIDQGSVKWTTGKGGHLVLRQTLALNEMPEITVGDLQQVGILGADFVLMGLVGESLGHR